MNSFVVFERRWTDRLIDRTSIAWISQSPSLPRSHAPHHTKPTTRHDTTWITYSLLFLLSLPTPYAAPSRKSANNIREANQNQRTTTSDSRTEGVVLEYLLRRLLACLLACERGTAEE